jgi:hypothetical protein
VYLAIDPGIHTGWAVLAISGQLLSCGLGENYLSRGLVTSAIIERPQVYRPSLSKGDPNDLITLAIRVGQYKERLETRGVNVSLVLPATWKGQVPKGIHHGRIEADLSYAERALMQPWPRTRKGDGVAGNVWDAVGLAKWAFAQRKFA